MERLLWKIWMGRGLLTQVLRPLAFLYGALLNFRFGLYVMGYRPQFKAPVPVIVVGNIFIGGTGKTPMVIHLVEYLRLHGWNPGVISRGYGRTKDEVLEVSASSSASEVGDEPLLIAQHTDCPMFVSRSRALAAQSLLQQHASVDLIIADDGLQHYGLGRDIEIIMFDQRGIGNGYLLPAGPLRETAKRRRDFTIFNSNTEANADANFEANLKCIGDDVIRMRLIAGKARQLCAEQQECVLHEFVGKSVLAAAGIGHPERFFELLRVSGLRFESLALPDHYAFHAGVFDGRTAEIILITEKDAVKCRQIAGLKDDPRIWVVPVVAQLDEQFGPQLLKLLSEKKKHGFALA